MVAATKPVWLAADRRQLALDLRRLGCEISATSDALESVGRRRLSASTEPERRAAVAWLRTPEGKDAYRSAAYLRRAALEAIAAHDRAVVAATARALGETRAVASWSGRTLCRVVAAVRAAELLEIELEVERALDLLEAA